MLNDDILIFKEEFEMFRVLRVLYKLALCLWLQTQSSYRIVVLYGVQLIIIVPLTYVPIWYCFNSMYKEILLVLYFLRSHGWISVWWWGSSSSILYHVGVLIDWLIFLILAGVKRSTHSPNILWWRIEFHFHCWNDLLENYYD